MAEVRIHRQHLSPASRSTQIIQFRTQCVSRQTAARGAPIGGSGVLSKAECSWQKVIAWLGYSKAADVADGPSWSAVIERLQQPGQLDEVLQRATEPVEFGHHEFTAAADDEQSLVHLRPPRELPEALSMNTSPHPTAARASRWASGF